MQYQKAFKKLKNGKILGKKQTKNWSKINKKKSQIKLKKFKFKLFVKC